MNTPRSELLRRQFDLTWSLLDHHLARLEPDDFLWKPVPHSWTVRPDAGGKWLPDWAETEPDPVPVPTIGWLSWHIGWWWSVTLDHARGRPPRDRTEITWPGEGTAAIEWLRGLRQDWTVVLARLTDADLDATAPFPWPRDAGRTVADMLGWVNSELMKNAAEIGQLRLLRSASRAFPSR